MSRMSMEEVAEMLEQTGLSVAYDHLPERSGDCLPYLVYRYPETAGLYADGKLYCNICALEIELYTDVKEPVLERKLEGILERRGLSFSRTENYIKSQDMFRQLYETEVIIHGE